MIIAEGTFVFGPHLDEAARSVLASDVSLHRVFKVRSVLASVADETVALQVYVVLGPDLGEVVWDTLVDGDLVVK